MSRSPTKLTRYLSMIFAPPANAISQDGEDFFKRKTSHLDSIEPLAALDLSKTTGLVRFDA